MCVFLCIIFECGGPPPIEIKVFCYYLSSSQKTIPKKPSPYPNHWYTGDLLQKENPGPMITNYARNTSSTEKHIWREMMWKWKKLEYFLKTHHDAYLRYSVCTLVPAVTSLSTWDCQTWNNIGDPSFIIAAYRYDGRLKTHSLSRISSETEFLKLCSLFAMDGTIKILT